MVIYFDAITSRRGQEDEYLLLAFIAMPFDKKVLVHNSTMVPGSGGFSAKRGKYKLNEITKEIVETEITNIR
jgi:hypothetical protein